MERDRVLARHLAAVRAHPRLSGAGEPGGDRGFVRAVARSHSRFFRHRLARPRRLFRLRRLHGRRRLGARLGRAAERPCHRRRRVRHSRLHHELHHRALPPSGADHDHARPRSVAAGGRQRGELAHRRFRRAAGHPYLEAVRPNRIRSLRLCGLQLRAGGLVHRLSRRAPHHSFAVRARLARHPRERRAHAGDRRLDRCAHPHHLHHCRRDRRTRRRALGADYRDRVARSARLPALRRRAGHADPRRHRAIVRRAHWRRGLYGGARSILRPQSAILVFLDRSSAHRRGDVPAGRHFGRTGVSCRTRCRAAAAQSAAGERAMSMAGAAAAATALSTRGVNKRFGSLVVAADVELDLPAGVRYALIGPNGAGKTTLINLITGMLRPDGGRILLGADDITALPPDQRVHRGLVRTYQINSLFPHLSALESVTLAVCERRAVAGTWWRPLTAYRDEVDEAYAILGTLNLAAVSHRPTRELAYGQQRLLEIALALASRPKVLLLDEPAAGVPREESNELFAAIAGLSRDIAVLFIEHDMELVFRFATRVIVMVGGSILLEGTPAEIASDPQVRAVYLGERKRGVGR